VKRTVVLLLALGLGLAGCGGSSHEAALKRLARAEADMEACKKMVGLEGTPTPDDAALFEPGKALVMNPERINQMRLKVDCLIPLSELIEARKAAGTAK
jgi:hypothetical protein